MFGGLKIIPFTMSILPPSILWNVRGPRVLEMLDDSVVEGHDLKKHFVEDVLVELLIHQFCCFRVEDRANPVLIHL